MENRWLSHEYIYDESYDTFCYQNCLRHIFSVWGIRNYDYIINHSMNCEIIISEGDRFELRYDKSSYGAVPSLDVNIMRKDDVRRDTIVLEDNMENLRKGNGVVLCTDIYYLPYMPFYHKKHGRHNIILAGEKDADHVLIVDQIGHRFYKGELDKRVLFEARKSKNDFDGGVFSGIATNNNWASVPPNGWEKDNSLLCDENLQLTYDLYYKNISTEKIIRGCDGIKYIGKRVEQLLEENEELVISSTLEDAQNSIYLLMKKKLFYSSFVQKLVEDTDVIRAYSEKRFAEYNTILQEQMRKWDVLYTVLLKCSLRPSERAILQTSRLINELIEIEKEEQDVFEYCIYSKKNK